jgi:hypothetical protein
VGNNIIEINGKRYDARSGSFLGDGVKSALQRQHSTHHGRVIDGFVKKPSTASTKPSAYSDQVAPTQQTMPKAHVMQSMEPIKNAKRQVVKRVPAQPASGHKPEKSKTLMRTVVKKPVASKGVKAQGKAEIAAKTVSDLTPTHKLAAHNVDNRRLARARVVAQNQRIQRFTTLQQNHPVQTRATSAVRVQTPSQSVSTQQAAHIPQQVHSAAHTAQPQQQRSQDLFEAAIANAKSHEQPAHKVKRSRGQKLAGITASVAAFFILAGFIGYMNMSSIEMRVASVRAGFSAQLPGYAPTGYSMAGGIKAQRGVVATTYRSGDSAYTLQQQQSDWDSQTLFDNVVSMSGEQHQTLEQSGRTVYIYGNNAAWVNGGVLYSLKTGGSINSDQILSIATSM